MLYDVKLVEICKQMEQRSPWVPAELAPFFSQHHKWSWSRPERSTVRLPLCADSIRNNCILASLHSSPFTTTAWHFTVFLCCNLQQSLRDGEGHCTIAATVAFWIKCEDVCIGTSTAMIKSISKQPLALEQKLCNNCHLHLQRATHFKCYPFLTSLPAKLA